MPVESPQQLFYCIHKHHVKARSTSTYLKLIPYNNIAIVFYKYRICSLCKLPNKRNNFISSANRLLLIFSFKSDFSFHWKDEKGPLARFDWFPSSSLKQNTTYISRFFFFWWRRSRLHLHTQKKRRYNSFNRSKGPRISSL